MYRLLSLPAGKVADGHERLEAIRACTIFANLDEQDLSRLASLTAEVRFKSGQLIAQRGRSSCCAWLITSGIVQLSIGSPDGHYIIIGMAGRTTLIYNSFFAEMNQMYDVIAHEPVTALRIPQDAFMDINTFNFLKGINEELIEQLNNALQLVEDLTLFKLRPRLARLLSRMHKCSSNNPARRPSRYSQTILAAMTGATRPRVNEQLQYLRRIGAINIESGLVLIRDIDLLEQESVMNDHDKKGRVLQTMPQRTA
nr:Crp/Fnr family transcriptional regulator [Pseudomonas luteola]